ncbi:MAG TPA: hypothetical protein VFR51_07210 [Pyrinomonadaceae bacterium]|nr:hypothetical protein [Pyrinomonadaceae bacterium]
MAAPDRRLETSESNRTLIIGVAIGAAVVIALIFGFLMWAVSSGPRVGATLQGAIRPGNPEFDKHKPNIVLDEPEGFEAKRPLGDLTMTLRTTVRNLTGKTITGLEIKGSVVDYEGKPVKEKTLIVVPSERQPELLPNKTMQAQMMLDGMKDTDPRAQIKMEVVAFKIKD